MRAAFGATPNQDIFGNQLIEFPECCCPAYLCSVLEVCARDAACASGDLKRLYLSFVQLQSGQHFIGHPIAIESLNELPARLPELRRRKIGLGAQFEHVEDAAASLFGVVSQEHRLGYEGIAGNGGVGQAQFAYRQSRREFAGIPNFEPVGKEHNLDAGVAGVVTVGDGIDDGFGDGQVGQFVSDWGLIALRAGANRPVDLGHDKIHRLIDKFKDGAFVNLIGRDGFENFCAVEVHTLDLRCKEKSLGLFAKKQDRQWPRRRWVLLAVGTLSAIDLALWSYLLVKVLPGVNDTGQNREDAAIAIAVLFPKCLVLLAITTWLFKKVITEWHGNVNRMLLLKLLEAQQKESVKCGLPAGPLK